MDVITTHEHADFDALASLLGAAKLYPGSRAVLPRRVNQNGRDFLTIYGGEFHFIGPGELPDEPIARLILVDTRTPPPLRGLTSQTVLVIIDHHGTSEGEGIPPTGANSTLLVERIREAGISLSLVEATLLLTGIYEDTGSLIYATTTPRDLWAAAWLLEQGADLEVVADFLHSPLTPRQRELYQRLLEGSESLSFAGHTVIISAARSGEYVAEISTLAHFLRDLYDPAGLFVLVEMAGSVQVVARSTVEAVDVGAVAQALGGGGHTRAAAVFLEGMNLAQAKGRLLEVLPEHVRPSATVGQIMSWGVHTLSPQASVQEAEEAMRRYGHEGFPVVEEGRVVGVLTRREIDRALQHGLGDRPVELYMHKGEIGVSPMTSVEELRRRMLELGLGQLPVVEDGKILGIVTRTDLIRLQSRGEVAPERNVRGKLETALPSDLQDLVNEVSAKAHALGFSVYLVGGFVRDLLLGESNLDLDLVVEGDAVALADGLAQALGGEVHRHLRFGTATWWPPLEARGHLHLDFTTARTEFYAHPTALPSVERSSIRQDLYRRDFTINTMAICLDRPRFGELLDFYGGQADLETGLIRVLHNLSFIEDPTRILRAVRLAQRLGFRLEERTEELMRSAVELLDGVSGERIRQELYLIFQEAARVACLDRLEKLGVLERLAPGFRYDAWAKERLEELAGLGEAAPFPPQGGIEIQCLGILSFHLAEEALAALIRRLHLPKAQAKPLWESHRLKEAEGRLAEEGLAPSQLYGMLKGSSPEGLFFFWLCTASPLAKERVAEYFRELRSVKLTLDGEFLKKLGLRPGPNIGRVLERLLEAKLDGEIATPAQEEEMARELVRAILAQEPYSSGSPN